MLQESHRPNALKSIQHKLPTHFCRLSGPTAELHFCRSLLALPPSPLVLNDVSKKRRESWNNISEMFSESRPKIRPEIRPEISCASWQVEKSPPPQKKNSKHDSCNCDVEHVDYVGKDVALPNLQKCVVKVRWKLIWNLFWELNSSMSIVVSMTPSWLMLGYIMGGNNVLSNPGLLLWCCLVFAFWPKHLVNPP